MDYVRDVGARATAVKVSFGGGSGIVPWSVTQATVDASPNGDIIVMKYDSTGANIGNFGAIRTFAEYATPEQKKRFLPGLLSGRQAISVALTEPTKPVSLGFKPFTTVVT